MAAFLFLGLTLIKSARVESRKPRERLDGNTEQTSNHSGARSSDEHNDAHGSALWFLVQVRVCVELGRS